MSTAGPEGWNPPPWGVGLPKGPRINPPFWLYTRMSGVNGLFGANVPPGCNDWSLHTLGMPCPDSRTNTWKLCELPRKAMPVGALRPLAKTDALNPAGRLMDGGSVGSKNGAVDRRRATGARFAAQIAEQRLAPDISTAHRTFPPHLVTQRALYPISGPKMPLFPHPARTPGRACRRGSWAACVRSLSIFVPASRVMIEQPLSGIAGHARYGIPPTREAVRQHPRKGAMVIEQLWIREHPQLQGRSQIADSAGI
jgi:hypothetical protein